MKLLIIMAAASAILLACRTGAAGPDSGQSPPSDVELYGKTVVHFATQEEAAAILTTADAFVKAMSPFDRAARMKTDKAVSQEQYLAFVGKQVQPWTAAEVARATTILEKTRLLLKPLQLSLPGKILLIKTTGREEGNAAYCRGDAIVFPQSEVDGLGPKLLIHELFHILSRNNADLRRQLYALIGFSPCGAVEMPESLAPIKITNPDGFLLDYAIELTAGGKAVTAVPVLYSSQPKYDVRAGGEFFDYLTFQLMLLDKRDGKWVAARKASDDPVLLDPRQTDYLAKVGRNTSYIIHPDEVLADNFALLVLRAGRTDGVPTPAVLEGLKRILWTTPSAPPAAGAAPAVKSSFRGQPEG